MSKSAADGVVRWLLEGDPAIRWQASRYLLGAGERTVERERRKVARAGWGARLLARQDPGGTWGKGLYSPKWISTTYTMLLLRDLGLPPSNRRALEACALLLDGGFQRDGGINYDWRGKSESCITGMVLSILATFRHEDERLDTLAEHLLERTGEPIKPVILRLSFPPRWHYDVIRALDHFREVDARRDARLADAIDVLRRARRADGRWPLEHRYRGKTFFEMERLGAPSRWNTLRALRVLKWWEGSRRNQSR